MQPFFLKSGLFGFAAICLLTSCPTQAQLSPASQAAAPVNGHPKPVAAGSRANEEYPNFFTGEGGAKSTGIDWVKVIAVSSPAYCSDIKGDVTVNFKAPGMTQIEAYCWQQPTDKLSSPWGHDAQVVSNLKPDADGNASFTFHADQFPNGPIILRIRAKDDKTRQDLCELQLFNQGGVVWDQGIPKADPPAAKGMKLAFADDFNGPLSISKDGMGATYAGHKTGGGDFSGWPFTDNESDGNPFSQVGTYLRIHASKKPGTKGSTGILSSERSDRTGVFAQAPCYFECRFIAQSAPGTWPAFWLLNKGNGDKSVKISDELDIVEAYGGQGKGTPNFLGYAATTHYWGQKTPDGKQKKGAHADAQIMTMGGKSGWSTTFHKYAVLITKTEVVYYFDDIEFLRHPASDITKTDSFWFMVNYAIGGISGWKPDLARYDNQSDMWVDYVRVYQGDTK